MPESILHKSVPGMPARIFSALALPAGTSAIALLLLACGGSVYPDRDPATVENVRVESARFLPLGGRFILADSATPIRFTGVHTGFDCSKILEMGLAAAPAGTPPAYRPFTRVQLPAAPDCPVDTAGRDTAFTLVFPAGPDPIRLANSSGLITDSAEVIRGTLEYDSLIGLLGIAGTISKGAWSFRDSSSIGPRQVRGDSLSSCLFLNQATWSKANDTVKVRLSFVTLDSAAAPDACHGVPRVDSLAPAVHTP